MKQIAFFGQKRSVDSILLVFWTRFSVYRRYFPRPFPALSQCSGNNKNPRPDCGPTECLKCHTLSEIKYSSIGTIACALSMEKGGCIFCATHFWSVREKIYFRSLQLRWKRSCTSVWKLRHQSLEYYAGLLECGIYIC